jgi:hypothetical protein
MLHKVLEEVAEVWMPGALLIINDNKHQSDVTFTFSKDTTEQDSKVQCEQVYSVFMRRTFSLACGDVKVTSSVETAICISF